jgi:glycosyltransferase involved in cell wall biosynthesis
LFKPQPKPIDLIKKFNFQGKFIIGYLGTHGMAHKLDFILRAAAKVYDPAIHFLFIGDGAEKENLLKLADRLILRNVTFLPSVSKKKVVEYLALIDAALIPLKRSELFKNALPSKIFESAAMQKPILLGVDGEARKLIEKFQAGMYFEPENESAFIKATIRLKNNEDFYKTCQEGCYQLAKDFDRKKLANEMLEFIKHQVN